MISLLLILRNYGNLFNLSIYPTVSSTQLNTLTGLLGRAGENHPNPSLPMINVFSLQVPLFPNQVVMIAGPCDLNLVGLHADIQIMRFFFLVDFKCGFVC